MNTEVVLEMPEKSHFFVCVNCGAELLNNKSNCPNCNEEWCNIICKKTGREIPEIEGMEHCPYCGKKIFFKKARLKKAGFILER